MNALHKLHDLGQSVWLELDALAVRPHEEGAASLVKSWNDLLAVIASKSAALEPPS
jgi:hypothetical protein